jgi:hypothetical protein
MFQDRRCALSLSTPFSDLLFGFLPATFDTNLGYQISRSLTSESADFVWRVLGNHSPELGGKKDIIWVPFATEPQSIL